MSWNSRFPNIFMEDIQGFFTDFLQVFRWHLLSAFSLIISRHIFQIFSLFIFTVYHDFLVKPLVKVTKHFTKIFTFFPRRLSPTFISDIIHGG